MTANISGQSYNIGTVSEDNRSIKVIPQFNKKGYAVFPHTPLGKKTIELIVEDIGNSFKTTAVMTDPTSIKLPENINNYIIEQGDLSPIFIRPNVPYESLSVFSKNELLYYYSKNDGAYLTHPIATDTIGLINFLQEEIDIYKQLEEINKENKNAEIIEEILEEAKDALEKELGLDSIMNI